MERNIFIRRIFILYLFLCLAVLSAPFYLFTDKRRAILISAVIFVIYIALTEISFRVLYRIKFKKPYSLIPKLPFKRMYIEPHPYLPYDYKKNFLCQKGMPADFPLNRDKGYRLGELKTNNFGHMNGPKGKRDIEVPKPKGMIRVNCLGASETASHILYNNEEHSYPMKLEKILKDTFPNDNVEVNNCGQGGFTSAGILVKFLLHTIDTKPDIVVIYHAYNDLWPSLTTPYQSDYSHSKKNLGEVYHLYRLASRIPALPLGFWNFMVNNGLFSQNIRFSLLRVITKKRADIKNDFKGLDTYRRNIEHMIHICKAGGIYVILSTFCYYLYDEIKNNQKCLRYKEGIKLENDVIRELALKHNLALIENDLLIPKEDGFFLDSVHFTPEGMQLFAENVSRPIIDHIRDRLQGRKKLTITQ